MHLFRQSDEIKHNLWIYILYIYIYVQEVYAFPRLKILRFHIDINVILMHGSTQSFWTFYSNKALLMNKIGIYLLQDKIHVHIKLLCIHMHVYYRVMEIA